MAFEVVFLPGASVTYCTWDIFFYPVYTGLCCFTQRRLGDCYFFYLCEI